MGSLVPLAVIAFGIAVNLARAPATAARAHRSKPVTVLLQYGQDPDGTEFNAPPTILVTVGKDHAIPVTLDTGSVGLRVFSNAIATTGGTGVAVSGRADTVDFGDGSRWTGKVATAVLRIGGVATTTAVPFELVTSVSCTPDHRQCPSLGGMQEVEGEKFNGDGVLGIGLEGPDPSDPTVNPLSALPGADGRVWDIDLASGGNNKTVAGTLTLVPSAPQQRPTVIPLDPLGYAGEVPLWDDAPVLCWTIGTARSCSHTLFDSGASMTVVGSDDVRARTLSGGPGLLTLVTGGLTVSVALPGRANPFWSFVTGGSPGMSAVEVLNGHQPLVNSGVAAFFDLDLRYDLTAGTISVSAPQVGTP